MKFAIYQESRCGKRRNNQDRVAYSYTRDALLLVVADGMGGHLYGDIAAQIAVQHLIDTFRRQAQPHIEDEQLFLSRSLRDAHSAILDYSFDRNLPETPRTTIAVCLVQHGCACWGHAGDSRLYLIRRGRIVHQTRDHSRVQLMLDQGLIDEQAAAHHPARNRVFSCLGGSNPPQIEFSAPVPLFGDDLIIMCTDGVWGNLGNDLIVQGMASVEEFLQRSPQLLDRAETVGGATCDNLSLISLRWLDGHADDAPSTISTSTMPLGGVTTHMEGGARDRLPQEGGLSDVEIERAIEEINQAIRKCSSRVEPRE